MLQPYIKSKKCLEWLKSVALKSIGFPTKKVIRFHLVLIHHFFHHGPTVFSSVIWCSPLKRLLITWRESRDPCLMYKTVQRIYIYIIYSHVMTHYKYTHHTQQTHNNINYKICCELTHTQNGSPWRTCNQFILDVSSMHRNSDSSGCGFRGADYSFSSPSRDFRAANNI